MIFDEEEPDLQPLPLFPLRLFTNGNTLLCIYYKYVTVKASNHYMSKFKPSMVIAETLLA
jgi:hypothetical protein